MKISRKIKKAQKVHLKLREEQENYRGEKPPRAKILHNIHVLVRKFDKFMRLTSLPFPCGKMEVESDNKTDSHKNTVSSPVKF
jgi:hypothetical protein